MVFIAVLKAIFGRLKRGIRFSFRKKGGEESSFPKTWPKYLVNFSRSLRIVSDMSKTFYTEKITKKSVKSVKSLRKFNVNNWLISMV